MAESDQRTQESGSSPDSPPPPPVPSSDPSLFSSTVGGASSASSPEDPSDAPSPHLASLADDIFDVTPLAALQLLGAGVEALVRITGDIPPTPPPPGAEPPTNMRGIHAEKEVIVRTLSENSLARLREQAEAEDRRRRKEQEQQRNVEHSSANSADDRSTPPRDVNDTDSTQPPSTPSRPTMPPTPPPAKPMAMEVDGVHLRAASPNRAPESNPHSPADATTPDPSRSAAPVLIVPPSEPYIIIGANSQPLNVQHSAITRKFYCKKAPAVSISEYLLRLHRFCPMSTGVYLATSLYIYRLAVAEKAIAVTRRNAHRLVLAGLRVAMKALEDLSYAHAKMALVGGVSEAELARLEINFCFLAGFELSVGAEEMRQHWMLMKSGRAVGSLDYDGTAAVLASMDSLHMSRRTRGVGRVGAIQSQ